LGVGGLKDFKVVERFENYFEQLGRGRLESFKVGRLGRFDDIIS